MGKILIAEDNLLNMKCLMLLLDRLGLRAEADVAENGKEAVEAFIRGAYDLVLMDIMMPIMDGIEATKAIRDIERGSKKRATIIAVTAMDMTQEEWTAAGMDALILKPINEQLLKETLEHWHQLPMAS